MDRTTATTGTRAPFIVRRRIGRPLAVPIRAAIAVTVGAGAILATFVVAPTAWAADPGIEMGTAASFSVLGGQSVTNTGPSMVAGDLGVSPGTAISGFPPGLAIGAMYSATAQAQQAQADLTVAYNDAAGRAPTANIAGDLGGLTLTSGVYQAAESIGLTGDLTLDAQGDPAATFIFQIGSTLTTGSSGTITLTNDAQPCHVFWQVGSSATLGTSTNFAGTIMALTSVTLTTGAALTGRALARNGSVTLDTNTITMPACDTDTPPTDTTTSPVDTRPTTTVEAPPVATGPDSTGGSVTDSGSTSSETIGDTPQVINSEAESSTALVPPGNQAGPGRPAGGATRPTPLAATGPSMVGPLLGASGLFLSAGAVLLGVASRRRRPRRAV